MSYDKDTISENRIKKSYTPSPITNEKGMDDKENESYHQSYLQSREFEPMGKKDYSPLRYP